MTRGGGQKSRPDEPERRCIATGETQPRAGLIRFVAGPDDQVVPDLLGKLPGRGGIWVSADRKALEKAVAKGLFFRAGGRSVRSQPPLTGWLRTWKRRWRIGSCT